MNKNDWFEVIEDDARPTGANAIHVSFIRNPLIRNEAEFLAEY